ncbi:MAG: tol-pal system-associated acyl-CoA thioesterase [Zoogloeaceae bacterium]|nr:tol-pal system-associated acyl-CoA thioesterase [Zoogloeaceae bacterium]
MPVRVYYEDTDAAGIVYYASYLKFFERCRTEWMRQIVGSGQDDLMAGHGLAFAVKTVHVDYHAPGRLDDLLAVGLSVEKMGRAQVVFRQYARRGEQYLVSGTVQVVCVDVGKMKSAPIPAVLREKVNAQLGTAAPENPSNQKESLA